MANENDMKTSTAAGPSGTESPVKSPVAVPALSRRVSVYVIECAGLMKIGVAADPATRLKTLKTGMPQRPRMVGSREFGSAREAYSVEKQMHRRFHRYREHGEWFRVTVREALKGLRATEPAPAEHLASPSWTRPTAEEARARVSEAMNRGKAEAMAAA